MKLNFLNNQKRTVSLLAMAAIVGFSSCDDEQPVPQQEVVPTTYTFENVDYSGQTARIQMLSQLEAKAKSANDGATGVTYDELDNIFINKDGAFGSASKQIADKTEAEAREEIRSYFTAIDTLSGNADNIEGSYLVTAKGVEPAQMIAKGLMGALLYYQAVSGYLSDDKMNVDNTEVIEGKGTKMQHHWDEAFGYFGAPEDYLTNADAKATYWASYARKRASVIDVSDDIFNAFIEGRAAIGRNDMAKRDEAIATIKKNWELLAAANAVHYINSATKDLNAGDEAKFLHHWSEGKPFLNALKYNLDKSITNQQLAELNVLLGDNPKESFNNKEATLAAFEQANVKLQEIFGFTDTQMINL